jgi:MinD-like ATPase involved in chromosome partitioning or flagellar assembly
MALLAMCSIKGSGVTTVALGLAAVADDWARVVLVECDPVGGDLMLRHGLAAKPNLVDLASAARGNGSDPAEFRTVVQALRVGDRTVEVVVAPAGGAQSRAALPELTRAGQLVLNPPDRLVVADCGRFEAMSAARPVLALADVVVVVVRATADALAHLQEHLGDLLDVVTGRLVVLLAHGGLYDQADVAEVLGRYVADELMEPVDRLAVHGPLPEDRRTAALLGGGLIAGRRWRRLPLLRSLDRIAGELAPLLVTAPQDDAGSRTEVPG